MLLRSSQVTLEGLDDSMIAMPLLSPWSERNGHAMVNAGNLTYVRVRHEANDSQF